MTNDQLHLRAEREWHNSQELRRRYPTFDFYWHEQYERVYAVTFRKHRLSSLLKPAH